MFGIVLEERARDKSKLNYTILVNIYGVMS